MTRSLVFSAIAGPANEHSREAQPPFGRRATLVHETSPLLSGELSAGVQRNPIDGHPKGDAGFLFCGAEASCGFFQVQQGKAKK